MSHVFGLTQNLVPALIVESSAVRRHFGKTTLVTSPSETLGAHRRGPLPCLWGLCSCLQDGTGYVFTMIINTMKKATKGLLSNAHYACTSQSSIM